MKYLEELTNGDCFVYNAKSFVLTTDFKKNGDRLAVCLSDGNNQWLKSDSMVENIDIFTLDKDNNIIAIKERKKDAANSIQDVS